MRKSESAGTMPLPVFSVPLSDILEVVMCVVCGVWADLLSDFVKTRRGEGTISAKERQSM